MARIVKMTHDRFDGMNQIDVDAWSDWATKKFGRAMVFPTKQPVYGTYLDGDPEGSFIAVDEREQPVGYIFTRTLGKVDQNVRTKGLAFADKVNVEVVQKPDEKLLVRIRDISLTLEPGLDQSKEVGLLGQYPLGAVLAYEAKARIRGFALCYHFPDTVGLYPPSDAHDVRIRMLGMDATQCGQPDLESFIGAIEAYTRSLGRKTVTLSLYAEYYASLMTLFRLGYKVHDGFPSLVKLAQREYHVPHPEAVSLYEWAG